jgi:hypothetical protein
MEILQRKAIQAVKTHGGVRKAARALGIDHAQLWRLQKGELTSAGDKTLAALGITKRVVMS